MTEPLNSRNWLSAENQEFGVAARILLGLILFIAGFLVGCCCVLFR